VWSNLDRGDQKNHGSRGVELKTWTIEVNAEMFWHAMELITRGYPIKLWNWLYIYAYIYIIYIYILLLLLLLLLLIIFIIVVIIIIITYATFNDG
jgi:hypothetical protein